MSREPSDARRRRCKWAEVSDLDRAYHDIEWGVASRDDRHLFEMLILEGAQAGLSWITILKRRDTYRKAYDRFDPKKMAKWTAAKMRSLLKDPGIIRNKLKVASAKTNAQAFLQIVEEHGSFSDYLWSFAGGKPTQNSWKTMSQIPVTTQESDAMSKALKKVGFKFVGSTICYAFMQAVGMINDHTTDCFRHREV